MTDEETKYIENMSLAAKKAAIILRASLTSTKNDALNHAIELIDANRSEIKLINTQDLEEAQSVGLADAMLDRLTLDDKAIDALMKSLQEIIALKDPVGETIEGWSLPNGLSISKVRSPIGVVGIIYESRPNVTIDVAALTLKSGNACILRGGKEAIFSNKYLAGLMQKAISKANLPSDCVQLIDRTDRHLMDALLTQDDKIDLIVPRGGEALIKYVAKTSTIPVVKHDKGVCHVYIHHSANFEMAKDIILNAKTQRPGVCNAAETLLIDKDFADTEKLLVALDKAEVTLRADLKTKDFLGDTVKIHDLTKEGYNCEYLSLELSLKIVENLEEAIIHIQNYTSYHSEAIISNDYKEIEEFLNRLDSAALFVNASTRFHDGGQFGLGAEVGISTGKLHARGPMGLRDLTTYKYIVRGNGQVRA